jgi:hypothetical protein
VAGQTPRFGLNFFGNDTSGTFSDDSDKYTSEDRLLIDRLLTAFENHDHHKNEQLLAPTDVPTATLDSSGSGTLEAGGTYYYVVSFIDAAGLETVSGPEVSIDMPDLLETPDLPQGETGTVTGNQLTPGQYYYALSGLRDGEESALSDPSAITLLSDENTVTLTLPALGDATSFQIWRMKDTDPGYTRIGTSSTGTFIDDGSVPAGVYGDPANFTPTGVGGADTYSIVIDLGPDDATAVQNTSGWRLYRSDTSGVYSAASLVHEVIEREDDLDPTSDRLTEWTDTGDAFLLGSPKQIANTMDIAAFVIDENDALPDASAYPDGYPMLDANFALYVARSGGWIEITGGAAQRGVALFTGTTDPTTMPSGAVSGDVYINTTSGDIFVL